ncbi:hypothetical protein [Streptomyces altiplanensis]
MDRLIRRRTARHPGRRPAAWRTDRARLLRLSAVVAALIAVALAGRAQDSTGSPGGAGQAVGAGATATQAARSAAQTHLGLLSGGDWATAWDGWSGDAQRHVPRDTYVRTHRICHPLLAVPLETVRAVPLDRRTVEVGWRGGGTSGTLRMVSEGGGWRVAPTRAQLGPYADGPGEAVAALRRRGECPRQEAAGRVPGASSAGA